MPALPFTGKMPALPFTGKMPALPFTGKMPAPPMKTRELTIYRRRLPHWRLPGSVYFVSWRLAEHQFELSPAERTVVVAVIKHFEGTRYALPAYVVMDDHVHVLVMPVEGVELHKIVHSWKSFSAKRMVAEGARISPVWQREYFDRIVRDDDELVEKAQYILGNPWKRWPGIEDYPWVCIGTCF